MYKCLRCGHVFDTIPRDPGVRCPKCSYKIILKIRDSGVVVVKAV